MRKGESDLATIIATTVVFTMAACGTTTTRTIRLDDEGTEDGSGTQPSGSPQQGQPPSTGMPPPQGGRGPGPSANGSCGSAPNVLACAACCEQAQPKGADFYYAALDACFCRTPGVCKAQCGQTICAAQPQQADQACMACLEQNEACYDSADQTCSGNADCQKLLQCDEASQCGAKPEQ